LEYSGANFCGGGVPWEIVTNAKGENYCATGIVGGLDPGFTTLTTRINLNGSI
jgi:hypothetical protein